MLFPARVAGGATGQHFQPAPKGLFGIEHEHIADHAQKGLLERFPRFVLATARDDQQELVKAVEVAVVELAEGTL